jgi:protein transport protein SEC24
LWNFVAVYNNSYVFDSISGELDTIINFLAKQSIQKLMETNPKSVKESLIASCAQILACYRKNCASPSSAGQLILPECMKLLPLYTNCLLKSDALSGAADVGCDDRAFLMHSIGSMDVATTVAYFYPRLLPLHDLSPQDEDKVIIPHPLRCSIEKVTDDGVYILENGIYMFFFVGLAVSPAWVNDVFGVQTAAQINVDKPTLEERDNPTSRQVRAIVDLIRQQRQRTYMKLVLVRQRDKLDILFRHFLCEDRSAPGSGAGELNFSYVDFLCHMHKEIRALLG